MNLKNLEIIDLSTVDGKLVALLSYQNPDIDDLNNGYNTIQVPVNIRELQYSSRNNLLVNQSINPEQIAVENDSTPDRIRRTIIHTPSPAKVRAYLQYL